MIDEMDWGFPSFSAFVAGEWVTGEASFAVTDPATGEVITSVLDCGSSRINAALCAAEEAFAAWRFSSTHDRSKVLRAWHDLILEHKDPLSKLITCEQGKPLREAVAEVENAASYFFWFAEEARRYRGEVLPFDGVPRQVTVVHEPVGVVAAITPWNFPASMVARKVAPAIAAGCAVILKPSPETPLSALFLAALGQMAGVPAGLFSVLPTERPEIFGDIICDSPIVRKLTFTGSTRVGKLLAEKCAKTVKKLSLELGGNAPFIVFADADLDLAAQHFVESRFRNAGQTCISANRLLVEQSVAAEFAGHLKKSMLSDLKMGHGLDADTTIGPMISCTAAKRVATLVSDAVEAGARITLGAGPASDSSYLAPVLLDDLPQDAPILKQEIFGPVAAMICFASIEDAVRQANSVTAGLAAYVYSGDLAKAWAVGRQVECGLLGINDHRVSMVEGPFGGVKESGLGREGGSGGLTEFLEEKLISIGQLA